MSCIFTLALKDLRLLWRDKAGLFWVLVFPLLMAMFFGSIFGGEGQSGMGSMKIAVMDEDGTPESAKYIEQLSQSDALEIERVPRAQAVDSVRKGTLVAYVILEKGFGETQGFFFGDEPKMEIGIDPSRRAEAGYLQGLLMETRFKALAEKFKDPKAFRPTIEKSLKEVHESTDIPAGQRLILGTFLGALDAFLGTIDPEVYKEGPNFEGGALQMKSVTRERSGKDPMSSYEVTFPQSVLWGVIGCTAAFAVGLVIERTRGTLMRLRVAPITRAQVLAAKALACFLASSVSTVLVLLFGKLVFGVRLGHAPQLVIAIVSTSACFVGLMMLMSVMGKTEQAVAGGGWGILLIFSMIGGGMVPLIAMPPWMLRVSNFSPVKWAIHSLEGAMWRDFSLREMVGPSLILLAIGSVAFFLGVKVFARSET